MWHGFGERSQTLGWRKPLRTISEWRLDRVIPLLPLARQSLRISSWQRDHLRYF